MATKKAVNQFEELFKMAGKFVEQQKGAWDHNTWLEFVTDAQKKGLELNEEMKNTVGTAMDAMKTCYESLTATKGIENAVSDISDHIIKFIKKNKGVWDHAEWEALLKDMQKMGLELNEETMSYVGNVLETAKGLYSTATASGK